MFITTSKESRALDQTAISDFGLTGLVLMENAARSIFQTALDFWPELKEGGQKICILGGPGQNGGDGWVLARLFSSLGHQVEGWLVHKPNRPPSGDAATNLALAQRLAIPIHFLTDELPLPDWSRYHLVVDALFGTGLDRPLEGQSARLISSAIDFGPLRVLAVDLPSGLSGDTGQALGSVLPATLTVSLGSLKLGLFLEQGPTLAGEIKLGDIGLCPPMIEKVRPQGQLLDNNLARTLVPFRPADGHKGLFGHALLAGGSKGKTGALVLAALGAQRSGCGLVTVAQPASLGPILATKLTEAMSLELPDNAGQPGTGAGKIILEAMSTRQSLGLGPGLGLGNTAAELVSEVAVELEKPLVLDADALTHLAGRASLLKQAQGPRILTPHAAEAARLLELSTQEILNHRFKSAKTLAQLTGAVVVLKGRFSIIIDSHGLYFINASGNNILASGGSGDLLTGLITGLLAQKLPPLNAAALGTYIHGRAADLAVMTLGPRGLGAVEIQTMIPAVWSELTSLAK